jgi:Protein of unknown function (DUF3800)
LLWGDEAVRFVYMDEAGTSAVEPVTIVVGLIVNADKQIMFAEDAITEAMGAVPEEFKKGFIFHAKNIWGDQIYRERWSMADRLGLLRTMMGLPRKLEIPIAFAMQRRELQYAKEMYEEFSLTLPQWQHIMAFQACVSKADKYIRKHAGAREIGSIVAEDVPEMRRFLKLAPGILRDNPTVLHPDMVTPTPEERRLGYVKQELDFRVTRIRRAVHFVEKQDDPLLQLADAVAFGFRRFFSNQEFGEDFVEKILGSVPNREDFPGGASSITFHKANPD